MVLAYENFRQRSAIFSVTELKLNEVGQKYVFQVELISFSLHIRFYDFKENIGHYKGIIVSS